MNDTSVFSLPTVGVFNTSQRKVVQYVSSTDNTDVRNGHGTHVCGTVAGYREGSPTGGTNNLAPEAKIAFFDVGDADGILSIPSNLVARPFPPGLRAGARVFSFSWGTNINTYTFLDVQIDKIMHDNRETLVMVAAGNSGNSGARTVFSPALTKNGIAVGASMSVTAPRFPNITSVAGFSSLGPSADGRIKPDLVAPGTLLTSAAGRDDTVARHLHGHARGGRTGNAHPPVLHGGMVPERAQDSDRPVCSLGRLAQGHADQLGRAHAPVHQQQHRGNHLAARPAS